jgi:hypothetical protein
VPAAPAANCSATGTILREQWNNVAGNSISDIPLQNAPSLSTQISSLETISLGDAYGARIRGYLCPPQTGNYTFFISGDDAVDLYVSTDDNPANKVKIAGFASWTSLRLFDKFSSQKSVQVYLQAGSRYYIEVLHKEGAGNDHVSVGWQLPNGVSETPIPGTRLSPFVPSATSAPRSAARMNNNSAVDVIAAVPGNELSLDVYPNPFQSVATTQFTTKEAGDAQLDVYDIAGRKVQRLFSGKVDANSTRTFSLQGKGLIKGVYVLRFTVNGKSINKKVILAK